MTLPYDWPAMPHVVDMICPACSGAATHVDSTSVKIQLKKDVPFFQRSKLFEYHMVEQPWSGKYHAAVFYPGLHGSGTNAIKDLPAGYSASDWDHGKYCRSRTEWRWGTAVCVACGLRRKHPLHWPEEALYQVSVRGKALWAFDRKSTVALRDYIASDNRKWSGRSSSGLLMCVPKYFLTAKLMDEIVERLNKLLAET